MKVQPLKILLIEDNAADRELVEAFLEQQLGSPFALENATRLAAALRELERSSFDVILLDLHLPDSSGLATFGEVHARAGQTPIVILSGADDVDDALSAVRMGAQDYLVKGKTDSYLLVNSLRFAIERVSRLKKYQAEQDNISQEIAAITSRFAKITPREREVLEQIADGKTIKQIALALGTSYNTVKNQRSAIQEKLQAVSEADLVRMVMIVRFGGK